LSHNHYTRTFKIVIIVLVVGGVRISILDWQRSEERERGVIGEITEENDRQEKKGVL
jgi:hypothetical protein